MDVRHGCELQNLSPPQGYESDSDDSDSGSDNTGLISGASKTLGKRFRFPKMSIKHLHRSALVSLLIITLWWLLSPDERPFWWKLTQLTGWCLLSDCVYFAICLRTAQERGVLRDRMFTICIALSSGVAVFFICFILPFTPKFLDVSSSCAGNTCTTTAGFIALFLAHEMPAAIMIAEFLAQPHPNAYKNCMVEMSILCGMVGVYFVFCFVWTLAGQDWPYYAQNYLGERTLLSVLLHVTFTLLFAGFYGFFRCAHSRRYKERYSPHFTEELMSSLDLIGIGEDILPETRMLTPEESANAGFPTAASAPFPTIDDFDPSASFMI